MLHDLTRGRAIDVQMPRDGRHPIVHDIMESSTSEEWKEEEMRVVESKKT